MADIKKEEDGNVVLPKFYTFYRYLLTMCGSIKCLDIEESSVKADCCRRYP